MFSTKFCRRSTFKAVSAVVLVSSLMLGNQAGAKPIVCEKLKVIEYGYIEVYGVRLPTVTIYYEIRCPN
jgi:hypothetical protein